MQRKNEFKSTEFELSNGTKFEVVHNLPDKFGMSIENAFDNWIVRTDEYTVESFVEYVEGKVYPEFTIMSREAYDKLI